RPTRLTCSLPGSTEASFPSKLQRVHNVGAIMCQVSKLILAIGAVSSFALSPAIGQQLNPPPGYFDIPAGFDFPADKQKLEQFRASGDVHAQRLHVWNIFAGMTQTTPDGRFAIFETWFSEDEAFATGPV